MQIGKYHFHEIEDILLCKAGDKFILWERDQLFFNRIRKTKGMEIVVDNEEIAIKFNYGIIESHYLMNPSSPITHVSIPRGDFPVAHLERLAVFPHDFVEGDELRIEDRRGYVNKIIAIEGSTIVHYRQGSIGVYCK